MSTRRLYYDDAFLREFDARVLHCDPTVHRGAAAWEIVLDCSGFYPSSGGSRMILGAWVRRTCWMCAMRTMRLSTL